MSDKTPSSRTDDWRTTVLGKLGQVRDYAYEVGAAAIIDGGDFFHVKSPSATSHETMQMVTTHHLAYRVPVFCVPGNHDSVYGDYSFLHQQPLGVLYSSGAFKRLYDHFELYCVGARTYRKTDGEWLDGDPFADSSGAPVVRVVGIPFKGNSYNTSWFDIKKGREDYLVVAAHFLASLSGGDMFEGEDILRYKDLVDFDPDVYCFGHWHKDQGVVELAGKTFVNVGSLTRGSLSQDEVQRRPATVGLFFDPDGFHYEVRRLVVEDAADVFDVHKRHEQVQRKLALDTFLATLTASVGSSGKLDLNRFDLQIRERLLAYLEAAGFSADDIG